MIREYLEGLTAGQIIAGIAGAVAVNAYLLVLLWLLPQEIGMTDGDKAIEVLTWINDYIKGLPNSGWNNQTVTMTILDRVETALKGMSNENN